MFPDLPNFRSHTLKLALIAAAIALIVWNVPALDFLLYPVRLFVTFIHEAGHALMAEFTGGRVIEFSVFGNGTGVATTQGGNRLLILPAGYLGAAFFGAVLFFMVNRLPFPRKIALAVGTLMIVVALFFGATGIALIVGAFSGLALVVMGVRGSITVNILVLDLLSILTSLNAVLDLLFLVRNGHIGMDNLKNDAAAFAEYTPGIPAAVWALVWALLASLMLGAAIWYGVVRPLHQQDEEENA